ncbi:uncharacterized protein LOC143020030 isoform X2 [Oratosquilla oratoria]|uniref:uncharacterized protein LOC143020030 isoform X2 n=1 Tax=Oratosquilla oratoria TaxID=337810 RepID=UPI003F76BDD3
MDHKLVSTHEELSQNGTHLAPVSCHQDGREDHMLPCGFDFAQEDSIEELRHDPGEGDHQLESPSLLHLSKKAKGFSLTPSLKLENQGNLIHETRTGENIYATPQACTSTITPCLRRPAKPKVINDVVPQTRSVRHLFSEQEPPSVARNDCNELVSEKLEEKSVSFEKFCSFTMASLDRIQLLWNSSEPRDLQDILSPITCSSYCSYGCHSNLSSPIDIRSISQTIESSLSDNEIQPNLDEMEGFEICVKEEEKSMQIFNGHDCKSEGCLMNCYQNHYIKESQNAGKKCNSSSGVSSSKAVLQENQSLNENTGKDSPTTLQELDESINGGNWTPISGISPIPVTPEEQNGENGPLRHKHHQCHHHHHCHHYHCHHTSNDCVHQDQHNMQRSSHLLVEKTSQVLITSTPIFSKGGGSLCGGKEISEVLQNSGISVELMPRKESRFILTSECALEESEFKTRTKDISTPPSSQHTDKTKKFKRCISDEQFPNKKLNRVRISDDLWQNLVTPRKASSIDESFFRDVPQEFGLSKSLD